MSPIGPALGILLFTEYQYNVVRHHIYGVSLPGFIHICCDVEHSYIYTNQDL